MIDQRAPKLTKDEHAALTFLASCGGGFTSGVIARNCGHGRDRIDMAGFRSAVIMRLFKGNLVDMIDREKPAIFVITDAGRAALNPEAPHE